MLGQLNGNLAFIIGLFFMENLALEKIETALYDAGKGGFGCGKSVKYF